MPNNNNNNMKMVKPFPRARALSSKENRGIVEAGEGETSFRVYYGEKGAAVPFMWESQPGTPKHPIFDNQNDLAVSPLTPPPSYCWTPSNDTSKKARKSTQLFRAFLSSISPRRSHGSNVTPTSSLSSCNSYNSPLSWSTSSTSSSSPRSSPRKKCNNKSNKRSFSVCSSRTKSSLFEEEEHDNNVQFRSSSMCFGFKAQQGY